MLRVYKIRIYPVKDQQTLLNRTFGCARFVWNRMVSAEDNFNEFKRHMFNLFLTYKAEWYGKEIRRVDRFFASSKTCSGCGWKNETLSLSDRVYACPVCGLNIDRDLNAAISTAKRTLTGAVTIPNEASMLNFVEPSIYI